MYTGRRIEPSVVCNLLQTEEMNLLLLRERTSSRVMSLALSRAGPRIWTER